MANIVTGAMAAVLDEQGQIKYLYQGAELPDWVDKDQVEHLTEVGLVEAVKGDSSSAKSSK